MEIDPLSSHKSPEELKEVREHKKTKLISQMVSKPGLTTYEYNPITKVLVPAKFITTFLQNDSDKQGLISSKKHENTVHKVLAYDDGCLYFQALNMKNAIKKMDKLNKEFKMVQIPD